MTSNLSFSGSVELIKPVIYVTINNYWLTFNLPVSIIDELERLFATFIWRSKMHAWGWDKLLKPREEGGLGRVAASCKAT